MMSLLKKLFQGKDDPKEEKKEAKAVRSGRITPAQYAKGEKMEGDKAPKKTLEKRAAAMRSGKTTPTQYAKKAGRGR